MVYKLLVLSSLCWVVFVATAIDGWCATKEIPGNVAGQVIAASGKGISCVSVALVNIETCEEVQQQFLESRGNFFFRDVEAGTYLIKLYDSCCDEIPTDASEINLGQGRTKNITVTVLPDEE